MYALVILGGVVYDTAFLFEEIQLYLSSSKII